MIAHVAGRCRWRVSLRTDTRTISMFGVYNGIYNIASSTARGGGGSFKNRKPIGEIGCCGSRMAEQNTDGPNCPTVKLPN